MSMPAALLLREEGYLDRDLYSRGIDCSGTWGKEQEKALEEIGVVETPSRDKRLYEEVAWTRWKDGSPSDDPNRENLPDLGLP